MKRDYFNGKGKPKSDFNGVSALYARKDGSIVWRAHIVENKKLVVVGTFPSEKEAADAYDNYVIENGIATHLNSSGKTHHMTTKDEEFIHAMSGILSSKAIAGIINRNYKAVLAYQHRHGLNISGGTDKVIVIDRRDKYEE